MFDFAWSEIALVGVVALIAIGPKDMPGAIKAIADLVKKARRMAGEFQGHVDEMMREADLGDVRTSLNQIRNFDIRGEIERHIDADGSISRTINEDPFKPAATSWEPPSVEAPAPEGAIDHAAPEGAIEHTAPEGAIGHTPVDAAFDHPAPEHAGEHAILQPPPGSITPEPFLHAEGFGLPHEAASDEPGDVLRPFFTVPPEQAIAFVPPWGAAEPAAREAAPAFIPPTFSHVPDTRGQGAG